AAGRGPTFAAIRGDIRLRELGTGTRSWGQGFHRPGGTRARSARVSTGCGTIAGRTAPPTRPTAARCAMGRLAATSAALPAELAYREWLVARWSRARRMASSPARRSGRPLEAAVRPWALGD